MKNQRVAIALADAQASNHPLAEQTMELLNSATLHTWTRVVGDDGDAWAYFSVACAGGGTPPQWTMADDPSTATPPADAAGSLWRNGDTDDVPPTVAWACAAFSELALGGFGCAPIAAYFSCGGAGVFLVAAGSERYVIVGRTEDLPRIGAREKNMIDLGGDPVVFTSRRRISY